jgi:hypothetical protein
MLDELEFPLHKAVGTTGRTTAIEVETMEDYVQGIAKDGVWVQGTLDTTVAHHLTPPYTTLHHRTPPHTTIHHRTPPHTTTPPYTTIHHCRTPPDTTLHHRAPPYTFTGYHWLHAVATIFDVCVGVNVHHHQSTYMFGDPSKSCIHLYKQDATSHYEALLVAGPPIVAESSDIDGEWHCACSTPAPPLC